MLAWTKFTNVHFIGIGGIGMSGIAEILLDMGCMVSGSDLHSSQVTENLEKKGARIFIGHKTEHVNNSTVVVYSSAIDENNPEFQRARERNLPIIKRAEMLAELMRLKIGIAIAGSHGKTTTTSLVATIFQESQVDATYVIGGIVRNLGGNAKKGNGDFLIAEADESDGSFLLLNPIMAAITNIDDDHLDHYGTKESIISAFCEFVNKLPFYGKAIMNADDESSLSIKQRLKKAVVWYGFNEVEIEIDYCAKSVELSASGTKFDLYYKNKNVCNIETHLLGDHNVSNTLAAIALSHEAGLDFKTIKRGLLNFQGVGRRLEKIYEKESFIIIDDYGHHPTEIMATITTLKKLDSRPLCVVFEPHRYSRTKNFWREFQTCFQGVEEVFILPIYAASEKPIPSISSENLVKEMNLKGINASCVDRYEDLKKMINERKNDPMIFLTLGAGSISKKIKETIKEI